MIILKTYYVIGRKFFVGTKQEKIKINKVNKSSNNRNSSVVILEPRYYTRNEAHGNCLGICKEKSFSVEEGEKMIHYYMWILWLVCFFVKTQ